MFIEGSNVYFRGARYALLLSAALFLSSCATHFTDILMATDAPHETFQKYIQPLTKDRVYGEFCPKWIFLIPVTSGDPVERAWVEALHKVPGTEALMDVGIDYRLAMLGVLYNVGCYRVSGIPVVFR